MSSDSQTELRLATQVGVRGGADMTQRHILHALHSDIYIHIKNSWVLYKGIMSKLCPFKRYAVFLTVLLRNVIYLFIYLVNAKITMQEVLEKHLVLRHCRL